MPAAYTEDALIEQPAIALFGELGGDLLLPKLISGEADVARMTTAMVLMTTVAGSAMVRPSTLTCRR
jgi:hypothetical protein